MENMGMISTIVMMKSTKRDEHLPAWYMYIEWNQMKALWTSSL